MVTLLAWIAQRLVSSKSPTMYASAASWRARTAEDWNLKSVLKSLARCLTSLWNGSFLMSSVDFWYFLMCLRATVPGLNLWALLTPPWAFGPLDLVAMDFFGVLAATDFLAVCLVLAILFELKLIPH